MPGGVLDLFSELLVRLTSSRGVLSAVTGSSIAEDQFFRTEVVGGEFVVRVGDSVGGPPRRLVVIDGSSRRLGSPSFRVFIAGVAVYGLRPPIELYPSLGSAIYAMPCGKDRARFIAVKAVRDVLASIEGDGELGSFVMVRSHDGRYFGDGYNEDDISDEVRMGLEAWALEKVYNDLRSVNAGDYAVVVDGPTYLGVHEKSGLARRRIEVIGELERVGVPVVGVVKRVENSRKLCQANVLGRLGLDGVVDPKHCSDPLVVQFVGARVSRGVLDPVVIGPFVHTHVGSGRITGYAFPERVFWYVYSGLGPRVFRVEVLRSTYEGMRDVVDGLVRWLARSIGVDGVPYVIGVVDRYAKSLTRSLYLAFYRLAKFRSVSFTYDTEVEARQLLSEVVGGAGA